MTFDPVEWWAQSGGAWLSGRANGSPLFPVADVGSFALDALAGFPNASPEFVAALLFGRAAFMGAHRAGATSTGGTARITPAADGWVACNLARPADKSSVAAIVEGDDGGDPFAAITAFARSRSAAEVAARAQLFGVPAAKVGSAGARPPARSQLGERAALESVRVADLTSLWAGPTCARLLAGTGAHVVKIESTERPDGARRGHAGFYEWLHREAECVAYPFTTDAGRDALRAELDRADVVLEASRPRALRQLGVDAEAWVAARPGRVWLSITAYGRDDPEPGRVGFGDDAAAAGGLVAYDDDQPCFVGDAIADPLTGMAAARAVRESLASGGGELIDASLAGVVASVVGGYAWGQRGEVRGALPPQPPNSDI